MLQKCSQAASLTARRWGACQKRVHGLKVQLDHYMEGSLGRKKKTLQEKKEGKKKSELSCGSLRQLKVRICRHSTWMDFPVLHSFHHWSLLLLAETRSWLPKISQSLYDLPYVTSPSQRGVLYRKGQASPSSCSSARTPSHLSMPHQF